jgi:hypothetical protein
MEKFKPNFAISLPNGVKVELVETANWSSEFSSLCNIHRVKVKEHSIIYDFGMAGDCYMMG